MVRFRVSFTFQVLACLPPLPMSLSPFTWTEGCVVLDGQRDLGLGLLNGSGGSEQEATGPLEELQALG